MKIHALLDFAAELGRDERETLCSTIVLTQRQGDKITGFLTEAGNPIQCLVVARLADITCTNCRRAYAAR